MAACENPAMSVDLSATTATEASNEVQCLHTLDSEHVLPPPSKEFSNAPLKLCLKKSKKIATHPQSTPQAIPLANYERNPFIACWQRFRGVFQRCVEITFEKRISLILVRS